MNDTARPLTSLQSVILATGPFIFLWSTLRRYVQRNGAFPLARTTTTLNSRLYAVFSLALACLILNDKLHFKPLEARMPTSLTLATCDLAYIYHISKVYEYIDVFNLVAAGKVIGPHMAFHHLTMPFLTHFRVLNVSGPDSDWQVFAALNCFHHFWMYAYFGGVGAFRSILPLTGWLQLGAGIAVDVLWLTRRGERRDEAGDGDAPEARNRVICVLLLTRYAMLFYEELRSGSQQKEMKTEQVRAAEKKRD
ncbi:uncharacterized protein A1O9_07078 [Exophiala aquamarina CBS 119918]|uniref:Very-long-chain 3-oxoacyl-CoA synthase n=1 Tax=Exophiala aquamarina CBS 119918 TaxID=1182545 RepID=A0A072PC75_9EURO|nr:uncharacterized protein A1O9_07078 [Exophiala aquamarina CBS 119918]KEF56888.1 hypothetical protein A1O9_07078 [Exophiala aquamarina CBS 119918]